MDAVSYSLYTAFVTLWCKMHATHVYTHMHTRWHVNSLLHVYTCRDLVYIMSTVMAPGWLTTCSRLDRARRMHTGCWMPTTDMIWVWTRRENWASERYTMPPIVMHTVEEQLIVRTLLSHATSNSLYSCHIHCIFQEPYILWMVTWKDFYIFFEIHLYLTYW